jgi:hypothetical protein
MNNRKKTFRILPILLVGVIVLFVLFELFRVRSASTTTGDVDASMLSALQSVRSFASPRALL